MLRPLLLELAKSARLRRWITSNTVARRWSRRFVPGEEISYALEAVRSANAEGISATLDHLGENVRTREDAERARDVYLDALDRIAAAKLDANVSLKLTHLGLDLDDEFCLSLLRQIVARARSLNSFVRVDMEGSAYVDRTLMIVHQLRAESDAVGTVIQAYLYRSEKDVHELLRIACRIRLVKGAYHELPSIAFAKLKDVDANFIALMKTLLPSGIYHAIATHDPEMIQATMAFATQRKIPKDHFEFQMLYGIRTDLQKRLAREGYCVRVYIPFGVDWFPYFMRRLAERPANLLFLMKNIFR